MDDSEARSKLGDPATSFQDKFRAAIAIVKSEKVLVQDLLRCLDIRGLPAELAAMKLHKLTGRPRDSEPVGVHLTRDSWEEYLRIHPLPDELE